MFHLTNHSFVYVYVCVCVFNNVIWNPSPQQFPSTVSKHFRLEHLTFCIWLVSISSPSLTFSYPLPVAHIIGRKTGAVSRTFAAHFVEINTWTPVRPKPLCQGMDEEKHLGSVYEESNKEEPSCLSVPHTASLHSGNHIGSNPPKSLASGGRRMWMYQRKIVSEFL